MERNKSLDGLKYLLIVFVIIGHSIEPSRYNNIISCSLYSIIYSFHMPLFVWLSGYFYKYRTIREEIKKCSHLLEACIVLHICFTYLCNGELTLRNLVNFNNAPSWYLLSLVCWRLMTSIALDKIRVAKLLIASAVLEVITFVLIPKYGGVLSIMRTFQFFPFFVCGYALRGRINKISIHKKHIIILGIISLVYILYTSSRLQHQVFFQRSGLFVFTKYTDYSLLEIILYRYSLIFSSVCFCALILLFFHNNITIQKLSKWGQGTLFIYFGQTLMYPFASSYCSTLVLSLLASAIAILLLTYISTKPISNILMNPISTLMSKCKSARK